jgi:large conductance mechanosensitive channel
MLKDFKAFVLRGNVVDLAVAVVMGVAFGAVVDVLVKGILLQIIAAIFGKPDFTGLTFDIHNAHFAYGALIGAVINLLSVAAALFFFVVKPMNWMVTRSRREPPAEDDTRKCDQCLSIVPAQARRCAFCTSELAPSA